LTDQYKLETVNLVTKQKATRILKGALKDSSSLDNILHFRPSTDYIVVHYWQNGREVHLIDFTDKTMSEESLVEENVVMKNVKSLSPDLKKAITHKGDSNEMYISDIPSAKTDK
jgi:hypothetical protein